MKLLKIWKITKCFKENRSIDEIINFYTADVNQYEKVVIIGDIHSCAEPLKEVLKDFNEETLYIFVGDYFDRGIQPVETFNIILDLLEKPNVILIEEITKKKVWKNSSMMKKNIQNLLKKQLCYLF